MCDKCFRPRHWGKTCAEMEDSESLNEDGLDKWIAFTRISAQLNLLIDQLVNMKILFNKLYESADNLKNDLERIKPPKRKIEIKRDHKPRLTKT